MNFCKKVLLPRLFFIDVKSSFNFSPYENTSFLIFCKQSETLFFKPSPRTSNFRSISLKINHQNQKFIVMWI